MRALLDWLDERAGVRAVWSWLADEEIPGGARPRYVFGSVLMFLFVQQVVLGILLATYYSPSATDAWASTAYLNDQVTGGGVLRGLHHHGSSAVGVVVGLPFFQTARGGEPQRVLLQGGQEYGNLTLTRFYALHVFVLPIGLASLLGLHLALFRKHGVTPPELPEDELDRRMQRFFPSQLLWDVLAMAVTAVVLVLLTVKTHGAELFAPAQPASNFVARPEWYFLFLFQLLKYFEGPLQIIATVIIPGALTTFLVLLPWLDRAQSRKAGERMPVLAAVAL